MAAKEDTLALFLPVIAKSICPQLTRRKYSLLLKMQTCFVALPALQHSQPTQQKGYGVRVCFGFLRFYSRQRRKRLEWNPSCPRSSKWSSSGSGVEAAAAQNMSRGVDTVQLRRPG